MRSSSFAVVLTLFFSACEGAVGSMTDTDAGQPIAHLDAGPTDSGAVTPPDAGTPEAPRDAGVMPPRDAGTSAPRDAGTHGTDAGTPGTGSDAGEETMPTWRKGLAVGAWHQIPSTAMSSAPIAVKTYPSLGGTGPNAKVVAWCGYSIDTRDSSIYSAANGGHGDYAGNEVDRLRLSDNVPAWSEPRASSAVADVVTSASYYSDGRPTSRHSYYGETFNEPRNLAMTLGGARYGNGYMTETFDGFDLGANDWAAAGTYPDAPAAFSGMQGGSMTANRLTGDVYTFSTYAVNVWTSATNTWAKKLDTNAYGQSAASAYDLKRNRILLVGNSEHAVYDVAANTLTPVTLSGPNAGDLNDVDNGMVYDPNLDAYLIRTAASGGTLYRVDASTFTVDTLATTAGASIPATANGVWTRFLYAPGLKGVIYVPAYDANVWFLRTW